jgi:hypothetical protein
LSETVVISGAAVVPSDDTTATTLLSVPGVADLEIADPGRGVQLVIRNPTGARLNAAVDGADELTIAPEGSDAVPFGAGPDGARLHLQIRPADRPQMATIVVTVEPSDAGPMAVGQAIGGPSGLVLSASKDLEPGARAMLLLADGLFRLDVLIVGDTLQTFVRNLTGGELELHGEVGQPRVATTTLGLAARYAPGRADLRFAVGAEDVRVLTEVTIATLRLAERGVIRVSAQGIVHHHD